MADPLYINKDAVSSLPAYSANELRQAMALALMWHGRNMGARFGVRPGGDQLVVSLAGSTITVQPGLACIDPGLTTTQGPYWLAIPVAETHTLTAADATNPRKDIVVCRVYDHDEDASGLRLAQTEYLAGTPNPAPAEPAVPAGAIRLATIDVPASPGVPVVTNRRVYTVASGGILPVTDTGTRPGAGAYESLYIDRQDTNTLERHSGSAYETIADPAVFKAWGTYIPVWTALTTNPTNNATITARFMQMGKTVFVAGRILMGNTGTFGVGAWRLSLPVTAQNSAIGVGDAWLYDDSTPANRKPGAIWLGSASLMAFAGDTGDVDATNPFTWANLDQLRFSLTYEAA